MVIVIFVFVQLQEVGPDHFAVLEEGVGTQHRFGWMELYAIQSFIKFRKLIYSFLRQHG
jgi:hypothetical protein